MRTNEMRLGKILLELMIDTSGDGRVNSIAEQQNRNKYRMPQSMQVASSKYLRPKERKERLGQIFLRNWCFVLEEKYSPTTFEESEWKEAETVHNPTFLIFWERGEWSVLEYRSLLQICFIQIVGREKRACFIRFTILLVGKLKYYVWPGKVRTSWPGIRSWIQSLQRILLFS